jgi:hypothetical protein
MLPVKAGILPIAGFLLAPLLMGAGPGIQFFDRATVRHKAEPGVMMSVAERGGRPLLRVSSAATRGKVRVTLEPDHGYWDLSFYTDISATLRNLSGSPLNVSLRIENEGADERSNAITGSVEVAAGGSAVLEMPLTRPIGHMADGSPLILIGMRSFPWANSRKPALPRIDPRKVTRIAVNATGTKGPVRFELTALNLHGSTEMKPAPGKPVFPLFDEFGQYIHWEWPGKTHSVDDMRVRLEEETADLARHARPQEWDEYGGWASGPALRATGAFRTEKYQGKWWLVDPNGKLFFSYGPACVQLSGDPTTIDRRRNYFAWLPDEKDPRYKDFFSSVEVRDDFDFGTGSVRTFSFLQTNLLRKYGEQWREESAEMAHRRLASWAMNTLANWSDLEVCRMDRFSPSRRGRTPYTQPVGFRGAPSLRGRQGRSFHDPYDPRFAEALRSGMKELAELTAEDPWCIGYFVQNEVPWNGQNIFRGSLESPPDQPAKQALVRLLVEKYRTVGRLNTAWKTSLASWQAVLDGRDFSRVALPDKDVDDFYLAFMEQYFKTVRGVVKEVAPKRLYLGCRFHSWQRMKIPAIAAARYADVVSVNLYITPKEMAEFTYPNGLDVPVVIGEWHFGARDRGQLDCGIRAVANQKERAEAFGAFMRAALAHPQIVGAHWFRYHDHPSAGRAGGDSRSNSQNGLLDGVDTPYMETIEAARSVGHALYRLRAGLER